MLAFMFDILKDIVSFGAITLISYCAHKFFENKKNRQTNDDSSN